MVFLGLVCLLGFGHARFSVRGYADDIYDVITYPGFLINVELHEGENISTISGDRILPVLSTMSYAKIVPRKEANGLGIEVRQVEIAKVKRGKFRTSRFRIEFIDGRPCSQKKFLNIIARTKVCLIRYEFEKNYDDVMKALCEDIPMVVMLSPTRDDLRGIQLPKSSD